MDNKEAEIEAGIINHTTNFIPEKDAPESDTAKKDDRIKDLPKPLKGTHPEIFSMESLGMVNKRTCCSICLKILYGIICFLTITVAIALMSVAILTSIATKAYDTEQSSRLVGMVMLTVTSAVTVSVAVYALVAVIKRESKPMHTTVVVLIVVMVIQGIIAGVSVQVSATDEINIGKSLEESFKQSLESNSRHFKLWALTQNDLNCCGVNSPDDYRVKNVPNYFSPNVPISCCPAYDKDRSELVQERERESCKAKKTFYDVGCKDLVINVFKETAAIVLTVTAVLIILEIAIIVLGCAIHTAEKRKLKNLEEGNNNKI